MDSEARLIAITDSVDGEKFLTDGFSKSVFSIQTLIGTEHTLRHLRDYPADLLLLDTNDDTARAVAALRALRTEWSREDLPVIVLFNAGDCDTIVQLLEAGATDFELKPLNKESVTERVRLALQMREKFSRIIDGERQRVMTESLTQASATTAAALGGMIDQLEGIMSNPALPPHQMKAGLESVLNLTEQSVAIIDRIRQIAMMETVPYVGRKHLLEELTALDC